MLTVSELIKDFLEHVGTPYVIGIPGHGCLALVDALRKSDKIKLIEVKHEQSAAHMADGFFRASGIPLAIYTSIGPGAINTAVGVATSYVDSTAMMVFTGETHTYMFGNGVLQEIERDKCANMPAVLEPLVKRSWVVSDAHLLKKILPRAYTKMITGRPGPIHIALPMNIQAQAVEARPWNFNLPSKRLSPPMEDIEKAVQMLLEAKRPVLLLGGGVRLSDAYDEVREFAEALKLPVITTMMGKSCFPENHYLYCYQCGVKGTSCGNAVVRGADVIMAIGSRFTDKTCSSFKEGVTFNIPPTKLIHLDIDPYEIGKNYEITLGLIGDAKTVMRKGCDIISQKAKPNRDEYLQEVSKLKEEWQAILASLQHSHRESGLPTISLYLKELQECIKGAYLVTSSGNSQAQVFQEVLVEDQNTHISAGGFSTMGFTIPAALGVQLAKPQNRVIGVLGDGDFLMTVQELSTAAQYNLPVVYVVFNNFGWQAIKDLQIDKLGAEAVVATEFKDVAGRGYSPAITNLAEAFGCNAYRVEKAEDFKGIMFQALASNRPSVVEVPVTSEFPYSGGISTGWWDLPLANCQTRSENNGK